ncbi:MAG: 2-hydroxyacid dehydrogenase [Leptolyngbyaceae cyanobacterium SL_1_1]|nr:2-hydroxyacid dehydrogenase [Leptolyngbyaceae cyanobacterium RM2_2_21]NJN03941.1 2-hydroxyacid dehydrogenase [Leptolyngbyaceae cyanobacterium RM1_1_2]NJO09414.1 2-hydroxyacid dehydrogenase [Leptolyngbyaceae cyanobacterium SL_1_1]
MKLALFSTKKYDRKFFTQVNQQQYDLTFFEPHLDTSTAPLAQDFDGVCVFVNDRLDADTLEQLAEYGVQLIALRCAGFNNVDLEAAKQHQLTVVRVPAYSPYAVAEHTLGLMLALNRQIYRAYNRVREGNFSLDGLIGFDLYKKTVGIVGTGEIGAIVARLLTGFGCHLLGYDINPNPDCEALGVNYVELDHLLAAADIVTLHCPLVPQTYHLIDRAALDKMRPGVMLINTSRGGLIDTNAVITALKERRLGYLGLDVYEQESDLFFEDLSNDVIQDDTFQRLLTFPNVLITGHQAFFTHEALMNIAKTTLKNVADFETGTIDPKNLVTAEKFLRRTQSAR